MLTTLCANREEGQSPELQIVPQLIPSSEETIYSADMYLTEIDVCNKSTNPVSLLISDRQATPREIVDTMIEAKTTYVIRFKGRYAPNGATWIAGSGGALVGYVRWKQ